jgi:hypothetical protein
MADKKIENLTAISEQKTTDIYEVSDDGNGSYKDPILPQKIPSMLTQMEVMTIQEIKTSLLQILFMQVLLLQERRPIVN